MDVFDRGLRRMLMKRAYNRGRHIILLDFLWIG